MFKSQKGITMTMVIIIIAVIFVFIAIIASNNNNRTTYVARIGSGEKALMIAEAGINAYMYHLNQDIEFYRKTEGYHIGGDNASEELGLVPENAGLPQTYRTTTYKNNGKTVGYYQIRVVQPSFNKDLEVLSTGWTADNPDIKRTVAVRLQKNNYLQYLNFHDSFSTFYNNDKMYGPVFSNQGITTYGNPKFFTDVITAGIIDSRYGSPTFKGKKLQNQPKMIFPTRDQDIKYLGKTKGLNFQGITCILMQNNKLYIRNSMTDNYQVKTYDIPNSGIILVEGGSVFISGVLDGKLTVYCTENIYITGRDPTNFSPHYADLTYGIKYKDTKIPEIYESGNNFSSNNFSDDMLGLISEKNIIIPTKTWPSDYGLKKYTDPSYANTYIFVNNMEIYAALRAAKNFIVEDIDTLENGVTGNLKIKGSKICEESKISRYLNYASYFDAGYTEENKYDYRFRITQPPHMVNPADSEWVIISWNEIPNP